MTLTLNMGYNLRELSHAACCRKISSSTCYVLTCRPRLLKAETGIYTDIGIEYFKFISASVYKKAYLFLCYVAPLQLTVVTNKETTVLTYFTFRLNMAVVSFKEIL